MHIEMMERLIRDLDVKLPLMSQSTSPVNVLFCGDVSA